MTNVIKMVDENYKDLGFYACYESSAKNNINVHQIFNCLTKKVSELLIYIWGQRVIGISRSLIWSKTLMAMIFSPCGEFRLVRRAQLAKSILLTTTLGLLESFRSFKVYSDAKERV